MRANGRKQRCLALRFWAEIAKSEKMLNNIHENSLTQYDCSAVYHTTILTVFKTEFKLGT